MRTNSNERSRNYSVEDVQATDTDTELKSILKQIPEMYSSKILEIIEKQKIEQQQKLEDYRISKQDSVDFRNAQNTKSNIDQVDEEIHNCQLNSFNSAQNILPKTLSENIEIIRKARSVSDCTTLNISDTSKQGRHSVAESQSLNYDMSTSCSEPMDDFSSRTIKSIDSKREYIPDNEAVYNNMYLDTLELLNSKQNSFDRIASLTDDRIMRRERENKAASVIGAYAKGYLVRRLMRTARVQTLIQTIQDALLCALELQGLEIIEEADVELHRRLIQQVSAACYEFHDVFFGLTTSEQMDLIAIDREKKRKILPVRTSRSSIDFLPKGRSSSNTRLTKSLTKI
ncbi:hypothetical protein WA026_015070 [Henosepilachna vigintioctopunctata]|uniref:Uncharacterized protein n=1 Tax=Henosepilachna vigintioctopunctata TaxID=420089 RepID=A0AAW1U846_9CUCU